MADSGSWHYVICRERDDAGDDFYTIREYYFGDDGKTGWTEEPVNPQGDSWSELVTDLAYMMNAAGRPVLDMTVDPPQLVQAHLLPR
jgi:hypothetical protein